VKAPYSSSTLFDTLSTLSPSTLSPTLSQRPAQRDKVKGDKVGGDKVTDKVRPTLFILLSLAIALLTGCAGYKLGPVNGMTAGEKSVQVNPFLNHTIEPLLSDNVTEQLRKQLQRDGTYKLASHNDGDIVVEGVITTYQRQELSFAPNDILTVRDYRLVLVARVKARERTSGKVILDQPVTGVTLIRVGSDLSSAERQGIPLLAADLAHNITSLLAEGLW
jgi:hypothetical protein